MKYTSDAIVLAGDGEDLSLLLVERKYPPFKGSLAFPGGFIEEGEKELDACLRELDEETNLKLNREDAIELSKRKKDGRDPRGPNTTTPFMFYLSQKKEVVGGDDASKAVWIPLTELENLAFDHGAILCEALSKFWFGMPSFDKKLEGINLPKLYKNSSKKLSDEMIVFFGGTFNPWHQGHDACLKLCPTDKIFILPDYNPWKEEPKNICYWNIYRELCEKLSLKPYFVYPGFCGIEEPNPTIKWIGKTGYKKRALLIGDDNLSSFMKWESFDKLLEEIDTVFVAPRNYSVDKLNEIKNRISKISKKAQIVLLDEHPYQHLSSTYIRSNKN